MKGKFLSGFLIGTTLGVVAGLVAGSSQGKRTRRRIINKSKGYSQHAVDAVQQYLEGLKNKSNEQLIERRDVGHPL